MTAISCHFFNSGRSVKKSVRWLVLSVHHSKCGGVAQLGEHLPCKQGVRSSILLISTTRKGKADEGL